MVKYATLAILATSAIASPIAGSDSDVSVIPANWNWHVEGWGEGCEHTWCWYSFNITTPPSDVSHSMKAYCQGYGDMTITPTFTACKVLEGNTNGVAAKLWVKNPDNEPGLNQITVSFTFGETKYSPPYNISGHHDAIFNQFVSGPLDFDITPTDVISHSWR